MRVGTLNNYLWCVGVGGGCRRMFFLRVGALPELYTTHQRLSGMLGMILVHVKIENISGTL